MEVRGYLKVATDSCRDEVLVLQPGPREGGEFDDSLHACANLLARGVSVRIIYPHRNRAELTTRMRLSGLASAGAKVRTVSQVPRPAVIFDATLAILPGTVRGQLCASQVRDAGVVRFLLGMFNDLWDGATPVDGADTGYAEVTDDLWQSIATLMSNGFTDEVMARKLGMSVRTCRRHIAALMRELDAVSRFQAGARAAHRGLVVE
jgi:DNA-binding CsgD family transcriptional regulator